MDILSRLESEKTWQTFFEYKVSQGTLTLKEETALNEYIEQKRYLPYLKRIQEGGTLSLPEKILINKAKAGKKRAVYTFPEEEGYILKHIAFMLKKYDGIFSPNLYSFRENRGVKKAADDILSIGGLNGKYVYKLDISNYFNSVDVDMLLPILKEVLWDEGRLYTFFEGLLRQPKVIYEGQIIEEKKGIMAGVPISAFLANLYLKELDEFFYKKRIPYMRYSDDIIVFANTLEEAKEWEKTIKQTLFDKGLSVNPEKEELFLPGEKWNFLGFSYEKGVIDVSYVSLYKLKAKMKRKTRALARWADKKGVDGSRAAKAFIRRFNAKLFDNPVKNELTWARWYFPVINTDKTLKIIDGYMQDCIRFLATGKRTKGRYDCRYRDMKEWGYKSLVNEYYKEKKKESE